MTKFFLRTESIYDEILLKGHTLFKKITFQKEFDEITGKYRYLNTMQNIIYEIENMNRMGEHFIQYQYTVKSFKKKNELIISFDFLPSLNMYCLKNDFTKEDLDMLVLDLCDALDCIDFHGKIVPQNIYIKGDHFYLADVKFELNVKNINNSHYSKQDDLIQLVDLIYQLTLKNEYPKITHSNFFKLTYSDTEELRKSYRQYMNYAFLVKSKDDDFDERDKQFSEYKIIGD